MDNDQEVPFSFSLTNSAYFSLARTASVFLLGQSAAKTTISGGDLFSIEDHLLWGAGGGRGEGAGEGIFNDDATLKFTFEVDSVHSEALNLLLTCPFQPLRVFRSIIFR